LGAALGRGTGIAGQAPAVTVIFEARSTSLAGVALITFKANADQAAFNLEAFSLPAAGAFLAGGIGHTQLIDIQMKAGQTVAADRLALQVFTFPVLGSALGLGARIRRQALAVAVVLITGITEGTELTAVTQVTSTDDTTRAVVTISPTVTAVFMAAFIRQARTILIMVSRRTITAGGNTAGVVAFTMLAGALGGQAGVGRQTLTITIVLITAGTAGAEISRPADIAGTYHDSARVIAGAVLAAG
jgi:hypothetical protein